MEPSKKGVGVNRPRDLNTHVRCKNLPFGAQKKIVIKAKLFSVFIKPKKEEPKYNLIPTKAD